MGSIPSEKIIQQVYNIVLERKSCSPENSYVSSLINKGTNSILKKIGEESTEVIIASKNGSLEEQIHEIADLWFHLIVLMVNQGISLEKILQELKNRFGKSGLQEKAQRQELNN